VLAEVQDALGKRKPKQAKKAKPAAKKPAKKKPAARSKASNQSAQFLGRLKQLSAAAAISWVEAPCCSVAAVTCSALEACDTARVTTCWARWPSCSVMPRYPGGAGHARGRLLDLLDGSHDFRQAARRSLGHRLDAAYLRLTHRHRRGDLLDLLTDHRGRAGDVLAARADSSASWRTSSATTANPARARRRAPLRSPRSTPGGSSATRYA